MERNKSPKLFPQKRYREPFTVSPPIKINAISMNMIVKELLSDLTIVSLKALFASSYILPLNFFGIRGYGRKQQLCRELKKKGL